MTRPLLRWGLIAALLLCPAVIATAQDEAPPPEGGEAATAAPEVNLSPWQVGKLARMLDTLELPGDSDRHAIGEIREVVEATGIDVSEAVWKEIHASLDAYVLAHGKEAVDAARERRAAALEPLVRAVLAAMPPVAAYDVPNDDGGKLEVQWKSHADATVYRVQRRIVNGTDEEAAWSNLLKVNPQLGPLTSFVDAKRIKSWNNYEYRVFAVLADGSEVELGTSATVSPDRAYVHVPRLPFFVFMLVLCAAVLFFIWRAKSGADLKVRKIAGLEAVDEAVGRATEMGRPMIFVPGILDISDIQTIGAMIILGRVARTAAEHDATIEVPTRDPIVMTAARETIQTAYTNVGRPDAYDETKIYFTTGEQFAYVANITGTMAREQPATCFYLGAFFAESLILAETGNMIGAIQIAGTAMPAQLPFFVAACDYTLIGEEFFAASAYLSGEPHQMGSLKGQDVGKIIVAVFLFFGVLMATIIAIGLAQDAALQNTWLGDVLWYIRNRILSFDS